MKMNFSFLLPGIGRKLAAAGALINDIAVDVASGATGNLYTWVPPLAGTIVSMDSPSGDADLSFNTTTGVVSTAVAFTGSEVRVIVLHAVDSFGSEVWVAITITAAASGVVAPVLSAATATPHALPIFAGTVATDQGGGTLYWIVTANGSTPSSAQIIAGQNAAGAAAALSGSQTPAGAGTESVSGSSGLIGATAYYAFYVQVNSNGTSNVVGSGSWTSLTQEAIDLVARMSSTPDYTRQGVINTLIAALKTAGTWSKIDALYLFAAHTSQAALLNWKSTSYNATLTNAPTFTTDRGFTGNGTSSYIDSNFNPATAGGNFVRDSASFGIWSRTSGLVATSSAGWFNGTSGVTMRLRSTNDVMNFRMNHATTTNSANNFNTNGSGYYHANRSGSNSARFQKNGGALAVTTTVASAAVPSGTFKFLTADLSGFSTIEIAAGLFGSSFTTTEETDTYNALAAYMTAVGA